MSPFSNRQKRFAERLRADEIGLVGNLRNRRRRYVRNTDNGHLAAVEGSGLERDNGLVDADNRGWAQPPPLLAIVVS